MHPGASEICNDIDEDCDGLVDAPRGSGAATQLVNGVQQQRPSLVWNGSSYGIAWYDDAFGDLEVYLARTDQAGSLRGPATRVSNAAGDSKFPSIAWSGSNWGVVWSDARAGTLDVCFTLVGDDGVEIGSDIRIVDPPGSDAFAPAVAWAGSEWGVAWHDTRTGSTEVYVAFVDTAGSKRVSDVMLPGTLGTSVEPSIAWTGSSLGVAWTNSWGSYQVQMALVAPSGTKIGSDIVVAPAGTAGAFKVSLAWGSSEFAVAWQDPRFGAGEILIARISAGGTVISSDGRLTNDPGISESPSICWTGSGYAVAWSDFRTGDWEIWYAFVDPGTVRLTSDVRLTSASGGSLWPTVTQGSGGTAQVAWWDGGVPLNALMYDLVAWCD